MGKQDEIDEVGNPSAVDVRALARQVREERNLADSIDVTGPVQFYYLELSDGLYKLVTNVYGTLIGVMKLSADASRWNAIYETTYERAIVLETYAHYLSDIGGIDRADEAQAIADHLQGTFSARVKQLGMVPS